MEDWENEVGSQGEFAVGLRNRIFWPAQTGQVWFKTILGLDMTVTYMVIL